MGWAVGDYPTVWRIAENGDEELVYDTPPLMLPAFNIMGRGDDQRWEWDQRTFEKAGGDSQERFPVGPGSYLARLGTMESGTFVTDVFTIGAALRLWGSPGVLISRDPVGTILAVRRVCSPAYLPCELRHLSIDARPGATSPGASTRRTTCACYSIAVARHVLSWRPGVPYRPQGVAPRGNRRSSRGPRSAFQ